MAGEVTFTGREQVSDRRALLPWSAGLTELPAAALPWSPGNMPVALYTGIWAHYLIGRFYQASNPGHRALVDVNVGRILLAQGAARPAIAGRARPDLIDVHLLQIWEIKSSGEVATAGLQMEVYRNLLGPNLPVRAGDPRRGTEGKVFAPGGHIGFGVRLPGVIRYDYIRL
jgi:hypothetical protein